MRSPEAHIAQLQKVNIQHRNQSQRVHTTCSTSLNVL
jgi:hypothetical protein